MLFSEMPSNSIISAAQPRSADHTNMWINKLAIAS